MRTMSERRRLVIKIGSSSLTTPGGELNRATFLPLVQNVRLARDAGYEVLIVSSGAVAAGRGALGLNRAPRSIPERQALAALGQGYLIRVWSEAFQWFGIEIAQVLLTRNDFAFRESYENIRGCLEALLERGVVPIINENDCVRVRDSNLGDNDMLGALISILVEADRFVIFTDTPGLFTKNPKEFSDATRIPFLEEVSPEVIEMAGGTGSSVGTGGMRTKLEAIQRAVSQGVSCFIGRVDRADALRDILAEQGDGTYFGSRTRSGLSRKKQWMLFHSTIQGRLVVDDGARDALLSRGKSLLPVGIAEVKGDFPLGAMVEVCDRSGLLLGRGRTSYASDQLRLVLGTPSREAKDRSGARREEVIHRDDWVAFQE